MLALREAAVQGAPATTEVEKVTEDALEVIDASEDTPLQEGRTPRNMSRCAKAIRMCQILSIYHPLQLISYIFQLILHSVSLSIAIYPLTFTI